MINTSYNYKKQYKVSSRIHIMAPILCFIFIGISIFANAKEKEYKLKNNKLSSGIEALKTTQDTLNKSNKSLLKSISNLDTLLAEISKNNN